MPLYVCIGNDARERTHKTTLTDINDNDSDCDNDRF